jgi:hypothetical protein
MPTENELRQIKQALDLAESNIRQARSILFSAELTEKAKELDADGKIIEGIFDGIKMIGSDKKNYDVPANYASKSKLVCGDVLKLSITSNGAYLYKQIGPVQREIKIGILETVGENEYMVSCNKEEYRVLSASITYFKAKAGDKLTVLVPDGVPSEWATVENIYESN